MAKKRRTADPLNMPKVAAWAGDDLAEPQADLFAGCGPYSGSFGGAGIVTDAGVFSTGCISESPSADAGFSACSLAGILETEADWLSRHPGATTADWLAYLRAYYLSPTAAAGILRRAADRGRKLPAFLEAALRQVAGDAEPGEPDPYPTEE